MSGGDPLLDRWKRFVRCEDCTCPWAYKSLGREYGMSMGKGWVRLRDDPDCPLHGKAAR